jgi:hypothetical protein
MSTDHRRNGTGPSEAGEDREPSWATTGLAEGPPLIDPGRVSPRFAGNVAGTRGSRQGTWPYPLSRPHKDRRGPTKPLGPMSAAALAECGDPPLGEVACRAVSGPSAPGFSLHGAVKAIWGQLIGGDGKQNNSPLPIRPDFPDGPLMGYVDPDRLTNDTWPVSGGLFVLSGPRLESNAPPSGGSKPEVRP